MDVSGVAGSRTIGKCIYCGSTSELTDEHVIPYGLVGPYQLKKASCKRCNVITSKLELEVLRKQFSLARVSLGLPSRRKKQQPTEFEFVIDGEKKTLKVDDCPSLFMMPYLNPPRYISDYEYEKGFIIKGASLHGRDSDKVKMKVGKSFSYTESLSPAFPRMIAKIAYGMVVYQKGLDALNKVFVLPCILGGKDDVGYWVGCEIDPISLPKDTLFHSITVFEKDKIIGAIVRLFASFRAPEYLVIVGELK